MGPSGNVLEKHTEARRQKPPRENHGINVGAKPLERTKPQPSLARAGCPAWGAVTGGGGGSALQALRTSKAPEAATARGERAAARRPPGERQAPGPQPRKGACCDCFEKQTLETIETPSSPISGPQFFKWSSSGTCGGLWPALPTPWSLPASPTRGAGTAGRGRGGPRTRGALTVVGRRIPLHGGPHRVSVVRRDVVALTVDVKKYIHLLGQRVLRRVHVGVAEARVVSVRVLPVEDSGVVMAHPARLVRRHLHGPGCARALSPGPEPARGERGRSEAPRLRRCSCRRRGGGRLRICFQWGSKKAGKER